MDKTSIPRLRRIRFKDGRTIDVLRTKPKDDIILRGNLRRFVDYALRKGGEDVSGYAIVVWDKTNSSICEYGTTGGIPGPSIPDYVRTRLLGHMIEKWTIDTLNGK